MPMTISTRQFRTIMRIVASPDDPDCVEPLPWSILRSLHELIRCDSVVFTMFDARRHEIILGQDVGEPADVPTISGPACTGPSGPITGTARSAAIPTSAATWPR
jgi:hypothetical protein